MDLSHRRLLPLLAGSVLLLAGRSLAQDMTPDADPYRIAPAIGIPEGWRNSVLIGAGLVGRSDRVNLAGALTLGRYRRFGPSAMGLLEAGGEVYAGVSGQRIDGGVRLVGTVPLLHVGAGVDYSIATNRLWLFLTWSDPVRRGGLLGNGSGLRLDWAPGRSAAVAHLALPVGQPNAGTTRPGETLARVPPSNGDTLPRRMPRRPQPSPPTALRSAALDIAHAVLPLTPPQRGSSAARLDSLARHAYRAAAAEMSYHAAFDRLFQAVPADPSVAVADTARRVLLEEVLIPYDRALGRHREPGYLETLGERARRRFQRALVGRPLAPERRAAADSALSTVLALTAELEDSLLASWRDPRLLWLPLQLALRPDEHDEQSELDVLVEAMINRPILPGHDIVYATDERFHDRLVTSVEQTQRYHVLWIHDINGAIDGRPDSLMEELAVHGYLARLARAAREFDSTGHMPRFYILLDAFYYGRSRVEPWLEMLADPLAYELELGDAGRAVAGRVRAAQDSLRAAVEASQRLRELATVRGRPWLRRFVRVNVSVTNPPDPSFQSALDIGGTTLRLADDAMRDHRKIVFHDISESDPSAGDAMITGIGSGEHYGRFQWLDRTLLLRGAAAVALKESARQVLREQGTPLEPAPPGLAPDATVEDYGARIAERVADGWTARAAIAMNETGFGPKRATAAKAVLYTLMPPGSTLIATDPQWSSLFWPSMLFGAALRGSQVLIVGPGPENAPFGRVFVQGELQRATFGRLLDARALFADELAAAGGEVRVGLFSIGLGSYNVPGGVRGIRDGLRQHPFLRAALPFSPDVWALFEQSDSLLEALGDHQPPDTTSTYHPRFHMKTQLLGTREAMQRLVGRPEWRAFFVRRIRERLHESWAGTDITLDHLQPLRPYIAARGAAERQREAMYLVVGSHNQDMRSLALDGEAMAIVAGAESAIAAGDMLLLCTVGVHWPETAAELDELMPPARGWQATVSHGVEKLF